MNYKVSELSKDLGQALTSIPELIEEKIKESEAVKECKTELNSMRDLNEAYRQAINKQQRKDVECLGKLTGYPQDWKKKEDFMKMRLWLRSLVCARSSHGFAEMAVELELLSSSTRPYRQGRTHATDRRQRG